MRGVESERRREGDSERAREMVLEMMVGEKERAGDRESERYRERWR